MNIETVSDAINAAEAELSGQAASGGGAEDTASAASTTEQVTTQTPDLPALEPHKGWTREMQDAFKEMIATPEKGRVWGERTLNEYGQLDKRFRDVQSNHDRYAHFVNQFQGAVGPYVQSYHMQGLSPIQGIQRALAWEAQLSQNPVEGIRRLAQTLGVDLAQLTQSTEQEWVDPAVVKMRQQYDQRIQGLESQLSGFSQFTAEQQRKELLAQVEAFKNAKDATGNPIAPYFDEILADDRLIQQFAALYHQGHDFQTAYQMLSAVSDNIKAKAAEAASKKAQAEAAARLAATQKAEAVSAVTKAPAGKGSPAKKSVLSFDEAFAEGLKAAKK